MGSKGTFPVVRVGIRPIDMPDSGEAFEARLCLLSVFCMKNVHSSLVTLSQIIITVSYREAALKQKKNKKKEKKYFIYPLCKRAQITGSLLNISQVYVSFRWYLWFFEIIKSPADLNNPTIIKPEKTK